jgi:hypothetical protein
MKKTLISLALALTCALSAVAVTPISETFINGSWLVLSNNTTLYQTNQSKFLVLDRPASGGLYNGIVQRAFWALTSTNMVPAWASNATTGFFPGTPYFTNQTIPFTNGSYGSIVGTPTIFGGFVVNTNVTNPLAWEDVPLWTKNDGGIGEGAITVVLLPPTDSLAANQMQLSNTVTCVFVPVYSGTNAVNASGANGSLSMVEGVDKLTLIMTGKNQLISVAKTNMPNAFMVGAKRIRLVSITSSDASGTTPLWLQVWASGFGGQN